ncbi:MAG: hypothetical protein HQ523_09285 [Lentisphaerae bacterium]|nr:hypothetical protein [Lentisphaerota bacterium]
MSKIVAKTNRSAYLANVLSIAKSGGEVAAPESLVLRSIIHNIGGTQDDLVAAGVMLGDGDYRLRVPESFEERRDNLQDMIMVAFADGHLSPEEAAPIEKMAKVMGYGQADMDMVVQRAKSALRRIGKHPVSISTESEPPPVPVQPPDRPREITRTRVAPLPLPIPLSPPPVEEAMAEIDKDPPVTPEAEPPEEAVVAPEPEPVTDSEVPGQDTDGLPAAVQACMKCRSESEHPESYCFGSPEGPINPWGCRLSKMPWESGVPWMEHGRYRDDSTFVFDKHAIAEQLSGHLSAVLNCPHLDTEYTEAAFEALPDRALIGARWRYRLAEADDPDSIMVRTTEYIHGCAVSTTLSVNGVDPIGEREAMKVIRKAGRKP